MQSRTFSIVVVLLLAFACTVGYLFSRPLLQVVTKAWSTERWPHTQGEVTHASVAHGHKGRPSTVVQYAYNVGGTDYQGERIRIVNVVQTADGARAEADSFANKAVTVFYNPRDPKDAVLEPGLTSTLPLVMLGGIGVIFGFIITRLLWVLFRREGTA